MLPRPDLVVLEPSNGILRLLLMDTYIGDSILIRYRYLPMVPIVATFFVNRYLHAYHLDGSYRLFPIITQSDLPMVPIVATLES